MDVAVITASVAVVVALITQVSAGLIARTDRRYQARRQALVDAQDRALALRRALRTYGRTVPGSIVGTDLTTVAAIPPEVEEQRASTSGEFSVAVSRVEDPAVALALTRWGEVAEMRFIDVADASAATEDEWFGYVQALIGSALTTSTGRTSERTRRSIDEPELPAGVSAGSGERSLR